MTPEEFERLKNHCKTSNYFNYSWSGYSSFEYAQAFLSNTTLSKMAGIRLADCASIFSSMKKTSKDLFRIDNNTSTIRFVVYTYPEGVEAGSRKKSLNVATNEVCIFISTDVSDKLKIQFKFGTRFKTALDKIIKGKGLTTSTDSIQKTTYSTTKQALQLYFRNDLSHDRLARYIAHFVGFEFKDLATISDAYFAKKEKDKYLKINTANTEQEVYIVVEGENLTGKKVWLNILDKDDTIAIVKINNKKLVPVMVGTNQQILLEATFAKRSPKDASDLKDIAVVKVTLRPKSDADLKKFTTNLKAVANKTAKLFLLVDVHNANADVNRLDVIYFGRNKDTKSNVNYWLDLEGSYFKLKLRPPIIVINPGHGGTKGNTGATYIKGYKHKVKGKDGKPVTEGTPPVAKIIYTAVDALPTYLSTDIKKDSGWTWVTKRVYDNNKLERDLVWDISKKLKTKIAANMFPVFLSRTNKIIQGTENRTLINTFANNKKADYFISVHADGDYDPAKSGSHTLYREKKADATYNATVKEFATDIFSKYTVVTKHNSPKKDTRGLQVLSSTTNKTKRKVLLELGYMTNTSDYNAMNTSKDKIVDQIWAGLKINIDKHF